MAYLNGKRVFSVVKPVVSHHESDPTVPEWAKQPNKPQYNAEEVGAIPAADYENISSRITRNAKEIANIKAGIPDEDFLVDATAAAVKDVPEDALPYAEVVEIGGLTRKCTNLIPDNIEGGALGINGGKLVSYTSGETCHIKGIPLKAGTYTASGVDTMYFYVYDKNDVVDFTKTAAQGTPSPYTFTIDTDCYCGITGSREALVKHMLNPGDTALPYEPYFEGLRSAPVSEVESVGINIWDEESEVGYIDLQTGNLLYDANLSRSKNFIRVKPSVTYYMYNGSWNEYRIAFYDRSKNLISAVATNPFTTPQDCTFIKFYWSGTEYNHDICINEYDVAINGKYYPSIRNTLPIPEVVRNLDGYGIGLPSVPNSIRWEEDRRRTWNKRCGVVDLGTLDWGYSDGDKRFFIIPSDIAEVNSELIMRALCAEYLPISYNEFYTDLTRDKTICRYINYLFVRNLSYTDAATFKAAMSGVMLVYELAEPIITDISDLLPADNLIGVEGGGTVRMVSEYGYDVPSTIVYQLDNESEVSA